MPPSWAPPSTSSLVPSDSRNCSLLKIYTSTSANANSCHIQTTSYPSPSPNTSTPTTYLSSTTPHCCSVLQSAGMPRRKSSSSRNCCTTSCQFSKSYSIHPSPGKKPCSLSAPQRLICWDTSCASSSQICCPKSATSSTTLSSTSCKPNLSFPS